MLRVDWSQVTQCNPLHNRGTVSVTAKPSLGFHVTLLTLMGSFACWNMGKRYQTLGMIIILWVTLSVWFFFWMTGLLRDLRMSWNTFLLLGLGPGSVRVSEQQLRNTEKSRRVKRFFRGGETGLCSGRVLDVNIQERVAVYVLVSFLTPTNRAAVQIPKAGGCCIPISRKGAWQDISHGS